MAQYGVIIILLYVIINVSVSGNIMCIRAKLVLGTREMEIEK